MGIKLLKFEDSHVQTGAHTLTNNYRKRKKLIEESSCSKKISSQKPV